MKKELVFFDKKFEISQSYIRLLSTVFIVAILAKGAVVFPSFALDDYTFISGVDASFIKTIISQGRYIQAAIAWIFNPLGIGINAMYFSLGIVTLLLYSALVVSILRFVGVDSSPTAGLVGAIIIAHPYLTEILTFRMALPTLCAALLFSIIALEMLTKSSVMWSTRIGALLATLAMLFTYQIFLNYFAVAIIFAFIFGQIVDNNNDRPAFAKNVYSERAIVLTIISTISAIIFVITIRLAKVAGLADIEGRANFITFAEIPHRIEQISSALVNVYWSSEPILSGGLKTLVALLLALSSAIVFWYLLTKKSKTNVIKKISVIFFAFLLLIPVSLGVIIAFKDWWPVPRVIAHVAIIVGLTFLLADFCIQNLSNRFLKASVFIARIMVLVGFIFLSNQIFADQQRLNQWDKMMANRIISRLEMQPNFNNVQFVHVNGGTWGYPAKLRTPQGDMNISALSVAYSKTALLSEVSGYDFKWATGAKVTIGETYCATKQPWPHSESITIDGDLAIVCLKK